MAQDEEPRSRPRRERPEFLDYWLWKVDQVPLGSDGRCPHCGHEHGPRFGRFWCEACGRKVGSGPAERQLLAAPRWRVVGVVAVTVLVVLAFAWVADPGLKARLAEILGG